ncbi:DNA replication/repair protein RecF [Fundicoccus culcitae]|uniref:DNA replication and repair protein RecF n=1 Tax=Fundicoccus culcitae TaxID=2969821 RepID=A0ABY5P2X2_9LACT|nr:DNA replication/repair protein RecF [Fundicoccus culcitae]UUX33069.1 DNA replication/repair protein RecF [Fundicoccus culcitae]
MRLKRLELTNFRNYANLELSFDHSLTIFTGENAQGKTNILEAIFLLSLAKSHRTNHDQEMIRWSNTEAMIKGEVETKHYTFPLELQLNKKGKIAKFNHLEQAKLSHFIGKLNVILFAPEDLQLIKGSPALRRRFLDVELGQSHPVYLNELLDYNRILKQRNTYLKQFGQQSNFDAIYFEVLTEQLIEKAVNIIKYRLNFVEQLVKLAQPVHHRLSNQSDQLQINYKSSSSRLDYTQLDTLTDQLMQLFKHSQKREKDLGNTLYGPHRDDLEFILNDKSAQLYGSQGQQRTIILSLKLAEIDLMYQLTSEYPILLLDDVLSELDDQRQHILMSYIESKVQTFLTTASISGLKLAELKQAKIYHVKKGTISEP